MPDIQPAARLGNGGHNRRRTCGDDLTWTLENRVLTISGTGPMTNYSSHNPSGVTIGYSTAPWSGYGISWVRIEDGVTSIGAYAFAGTDLSSLTIGKDVKSIESYAFYRCRSLSVVDIPDNVTSIGRNVFEDCTGLRSVKLPDTLTNIGTDVFKKRNFTMNYVRMQQIGKTVCCILEII